MDQALELLEELYYYDIPDEAYEAGTLDDYGSLLEGTDKWFTQSQRAALSGLGILP